MKKTQPLQDYQVFIGSFLNPVSDRQCDWVEDGAMAAKKKSNGQWVWHSLGSKAGVLQSLGNKKNIKVIDLQDSLLLPGFFDSHFHWVQDDVRHMPKENLLDWLSHHTWPHEARFKDKTFSNNKARTFARYLLANGTLGGACYSSIHNHALDHALKYFTGDYVVGNVLMTMNSPEYLTQTKKQAINSVMRNSKKYSKTYAMTPRFAPTTHPEVMREGAKLARQHGSFMQTHLSETPEEIRFVLEQFRQFDGFEKVGSYTDIYRHCRVLGAKTIMGHGIHLSDEELTTLAKSKTAIAHCPTSNAPVKELGIGSGLFDFKRAEAHGVRWALASDIGGGPYLSMLDVMRSFVKQNRRKKIDTATYTKAFYRATQAGAELLQLGKQRGSFAKGKMANLIALKKPRLRKTDTSESLLKRLCENTSRSALDQCVTKSLYNGTFVFDRQALPNE